VNPEYDYWIPQHLPNEIIKKGKYLDIEDKRSVSEVVKELSMVDLSKCLKGIGHFDLHRDNAMINKIGEYCIFDLATVDYHHTIFDLGAYIDCFVLTRNSQSQNRKKLLIKY
jgi:hypothetical protein